jgi:hypothetical protein
VQFCDNILVLIIFPVKTKFGLLEDHEIDFEDEEGAEIDIEVFPILLDQAVIPNVVFQVKGELRTQIAIDSANSSTVTPQIIYGLFYLFKLLNNVTFSSAWRLLSIQKVDTLGPERESDHMVKTVRAHFTQKGSYQGSALCSLSLCAEV